MSNRRKSPTSSSSSTGKISSQDRTLTSTDNSSSRYSKKKWSRGKTLLWLSLVFGVFAIALRLTPALDFRKKEENDLSKLTKFIKSNRNVCHSYEPRPPLQWCKQGLKLCNSPDIVRYTKLSFAYTNTVLKTLSSQVEFLTTKLDYFRYFRINLYNLDCHQFDDGGPGFGQCSNRACAVTECDEKDIPEIWRSENLAKIEGPIVKEPPTSADSNERLLSLASGFGHEADDFCIMDEKDSRKDCEYLAHLDDDYKEDDAIYISLLDNPERYTGYEGNRANRIWQTIYELQAQPFLQAHTHLGGNGTDVTTCPEQDIFYRLLSGMHASVSTHLCHSYLNQHTGEWGPNLKCFLERVGLYPDRLENMYLNYIVVLKAISRLSSMIDKYTFCGFNDELDSKTRDHMRKLIRVANDYSHGFDENVLFDPNDPNHDLLKCEFRKRFRNISSIMNCVDCDKCRLWGKIQTTGYGTALKILFEYDDISQIRLRRSELVALMNTFGRLTISLKAYLKFCQEMAYIVSEEQQVSFTKFITNSKFIPESIETFLIATSDYLNNLAHIYKTQFFIILKAMQYVIRSWIMIPHTIWSLMTSNLRA